LLAAAAKAGVAIAIASAVTMARAIVATRAAPAKERNARAALQ
jgi:hypothetical protein